MPSAKKKNKLGRLTGGSDKEREALQLETYLAHLQNNTTLQGIAVSTDSIASPEQRTSILSLMNILDEEGVLKKGIFYQLQNDRSVNPAPAPAPNGREDFGLPNKRAHPIPWNPTIRNPYTHR